MISKRFSTSKKASKFSKRVLGMESLENRELLSINYLGYDGSDAVQTNSASNSQDFGVESSDFQTEAAGVARDDATTTSTSLGVSLTGLTDTKSYTVTCALGTKTVATQTITASGTTAATVFTGLKAGTEYTITATNTADSTDKASAALKTLPTAVTVAGPTSSGATVNWTKPAGLTDLTKIAVKYEQVDADATDPWAFTTADTESVAKGNTFNLSGLTAGKRYIVQIVDNATGISNITEFTTAATGDAATVAVGPATDVKAVFVKASGTGDKAKPASVKVTWKAPANYTGAYEITFTQIKDTDKTFTVTVAPGAKLEYSAAIVDSVTNDDDEALVAKEQYSVVVTAVATTAIDSTVTYVYAQDPKEVKVTLSTPNKVETVKGEALADVSGGTKVTFAKVATGSDEVDAVGYWVGLYADAAKAAAAKVTDSNLIYVKAADIAAGVLFSDAKDGQFAAVIGVAADGGTSVAVASAAKVAFTAAVEVDNAYPAAAKGPSATLQADGSYKVQWTNGLPTAPTTITATSVKYEVDKWFVKYSSDGGTTWFSTGAAIDAATLTATVKGLVPGVTYKFAVEASVTKTSAKEVEPATDPKTYTFTGGTTETKRCKSTDITVKVAAEKVAAPTKAADPVPAATNTGISAVVNWTGVAGTTYKVVVTDANKAVLATKDVTLADGVTAGTITINSALLGTDVNLTPGMKYEVTVQAYGKMPGNMSTALKIAFTATKFDAATVKVSDVGLLSAKVTVNPPKLTPPTGSTYTLEITKVADAKGKPDWNAGWTQAITTTGSAVAITAQLEPSTQYFTRVVIIDAEGTRVATGKEAKFKTVAAPLATIAKPGFAMNGTEMGFKFEMKTPEQNDKKELLTIDSELSTFTFDIYVADDKAKADKVTGELTGAFAVKTGLKVTDFVEVKDKEGKVVGYKLSEAIKLSEILGTGKFDNLESMKSIQIQLKVTYTNTKTDNGSGGADKTEYATLYTKAAKLSMPKWFV